MLTIVRQIKLEVECTVNICFDMLCQDRLIVTVFDHRQDLAMDDREVSRLLDLSYPALHSHRLTGPVQAAIGYHVPEIGIA